MLTAPPELIQSRSPSRFAGASLQSNPNASANLFATHVAGSVFEALDPAFHISDYQRQQRPQAVMPKNKKAGSAIGAGTTAVILAS